MQNSGSTLHSKPSSQPPQCDVLVVLGCALDQHGWPVGASLRRAHTASDAWRSSAAPRILVSGGRRWAGTPEAEGLRRQLVADGVPAHAIVCELCSLSTTENAWYSRPLLEQLGASRILVVTCDYHAKRALRAFAEVGIVASALSVPSPARTRLRVTVREWTARALDTIGSYARGRR